MSYSHLGKKLQPLRVSPGWSVDYNLFFEVDPGPENTEWFYGSSKFSASCQRWKVAMELMFEPKADPNGVYILAFYSWTSNAKDRICVGYVKSQSRLEMVDEIERFMHERTFQ